MKYQELLNQVESLLVTEETLNEIKTSFKLIGKITLAIVLLVSAFIYFITFNFNKETSVTNVEKIEVKNNENNKNDEVEISNEEWGEQFEVEAPELALAYWHEETEELYHVEEMSTGGFGIFFDGTWCPLQVDLFDDGNWWHFISLPSGVDMFVLPLENLLRTVCTRRYYAAA